MVDKIKQLPSKFMEWWNKYSSKQKTIIISILAGVILALVILVTVLTRPQYVELVTCETTKESSAIIELLEGASPAIDYVYSEDGYQIKVEKDQIGQARMLLGANNIPTTRMGIDDVTSGGLSTTESDKLKRYKAYMEELLEADLESLENIVSAKVILDIPEDDGTMIAQNEDASAGIVLELSDALTNDQAANIAQYVKTALGNEKIQTITIMDNEANLLFSGDDTSSITGTANSQFTVKQQTEAVLQSNVKKVLLATNEFNLVEASPNLDLDFSSVEETEHLFYPADGQAQGVLSHEDIYEAETSGGVGGVPGTDGVYVRGYRGAGPEQLCPLLQLGRPAAVGSKGARSGCRRAGPG